MTRSQIIALLLGGSVVAVGAGLAWRGLLPGWPPHPLAASSLIQEGASAPSPAAPANEQAVVPPSVQAPDAKAQNESGAPETAAEPDQPNTAPAPQPEITAESEAPPVQPTATPDIPAFDTVRVEPSGDAVVAGHGPPDAKIELVAGDRIIAKVSADGAGNFVIIPPPLAPGSYVLLLRSTGKDGTPIDSHQNVAVSVPPKGQKNVVVALAEPGKPSVVLSDTAKPPAPPQAQTGQPQVTFKTAEVDNGGFYASGSATPGAHLRIYLNGTPLADVTAGPDGHWSLTIERGVSPGHYSVRADLIDDSGKVLARAEVPFDVPFNVAEADVPLKPMPKAPQPAPAQPPAPAPASPALSQNALETNQANESSGKEVAAAAPSSPSVNDAVVPQIQTTTVARGDSLWRISRKVFGHGIRYTLIYEANASQIRDPSLIYPGQVFVLPHVTN
ncbi:MAG TPA: LysM peptidoglycan-binding domain-containing protein [Methylovirgula sp.]|nr:LysM peptidoglycan-binding domain-containing protein [Methylovirgula sp.]